ncbi:TraB family protein [Roseovarius litorisediminis]|uniref:TraB family protein n=1 Tax=Roseovarius litorisediminis TaxID=1312363 RepID=A0A1Y5TK55_9RHOB|nr:TraB/GumN family protein [Roseovarius litorisediminis]SLN65983.1 TraB family protein [Roseovarius litorisediminis]
MVRLLAAILFMLQPLAAFATCEGTDLISALSDEDRSRLTARAYAAPYPKGLLWQAKRDETQITLFGTYHLLHDQTQSHLDRVKPLIDNADAIYLEVSNNDQAQLQREIAADPSIMFITDGATLPDLLGAEDWKRLVDEMRLRAIPGFMAARFKPFWAAMMLGIGPCEARSGLMEKKGIDARIGDYAQSIGNDSRSLEDYRTLLTLFDDFPQKDQLDMIRLFFTWSGDADDLAYTLRKRYLDQEIALIWEFSRYISDEFGDAKAARDFEVFEQQLLNRRNQGWVERLMDQASGQQVFMAVGAAHLPGETGVLQLLADKGFSITRLPFEK